MNAIPVIDVQKRRKGRVRRESRDCEARPVSTPDGIRYRCERLPYDPKCSRFGNCPLLPIFVDSPLNPLTTQTYFERFSPFPYGSPEWQVHYNKRVSVERTFSRLKTYRKLNEIRTRRMPKVWLHVALSVLAMNGSALAKIRAGEPESLRVCTARAA